jgi:filamentous hemagglutinin family protein
MGMRRRRRTGGQAGQAGRALLRLRRRALLASTALQAGFALGFALPAAAQPAPDAGPQGGTVVAGQAGIARQGNATTITQSTDRAAIDWRTFDVGRDHTVRFQQPGASSMTLNRVTSPRPSEIAGRIQANGGVVVINGAGVLFHRGAQVEAQSFVASTADTTNAAFMAGRLQFDRPGRPGARIENRGEITVREAGLAALVAPGVANSGTIRARLGTVVLAGAETHTIDLHGDGLVAFDVTGQVRTAPRGADGQAAQALVTNSGVVVAEGGTVLMTARAADGVVQQLVSAGGTIRADSSGTRTGSVEIAGVGGGIRIHGTVAAEGRRAGERGGTVVARASGDVEIAPSARVSASGAAGGGTVAIGTTAVRARAQGGGVPADAAARVRVADGAEIRADATQAGTGGRIAIIGRSAVAMAGKVGARGGPKGGDGGQVEVSADRGLTIAGGVDTRAPAGKAGTLLLDPLNLHIVGAIPDPPGAAQPANPAAPQVGAGDAAPGGGDDGYLLADTVAALLGGGNVRLEAGNDLTVSEAIGFALNANSLTLAAGNSVVVNQPVTLQGDVILLASDPAIPGATATGQVQVNAAIASTAGSVFLRAFGDAGQVAFGAGGTAEAAGRVTLVANAMTLPTAAGAIQAPVVEISPNAGRALSFGAGAATGLALPQLSGVQAGLLRLGAATLPGGGPTTLASDATLSGGLALSGVDLDLRATGALTQTAALGLAGGTLRAEAGRIQLDNAGNAIARVGALTAGAGDLTVVTAGALAAREAISATGTATLRAGGTLDLEPGAAIGGAAISLRAGPGGMQLRGGIATPGTLELGTTGAVGGAGGIAAGRLAGAVGSLALGGTTPAAIAVISDLTVRGDFDLRAAGPLAVTGTLRAGLLTDGDLTLTLASGALTAGGVIGTGTAGLSGGDIALSAPGGVTLQGSLRAGASAGRAGDIAIVASAGEIRQTAGGVVAAGTLSLAGAAGVAQAGGTLDARDFAAATSVAGAAIELGGANRLDTLRTVSAAGSIGLNNAIALAVAGPVRAGQAPVGAPAVGAQAEALIIAAGAISVTGTIAAGQAGGGGAPAVAGTVRLQSDDSAQRGGAASAAAIDIAPGAAILAARSGGRGGAVTLAATSAVPGGGTVAIRAPIAVPAGGSIAVTAHAVSVGGGSGGVGALAAPSGRIALTTDALVLEGIPAAGLNLGAAGGTVTIAQRSAATAVALGGAGPGLALDGDALARIAADTLRIGRSDGGAVTINGPASLPSVRTLDLLSGGGLSAAAGGTLTVNRLTGTLGGGIALDTPGGPHRVGTIGALSAGGSLAYRGQGDLAVDGAVRGGATVALATEPGGSLTLLPGGSVAAASSGMVTLQADAMALGGPVAAPGGRIEILPATSGRAMTLGGAGGLSLAQADLDRLSASTLLLGGREAGPAQAGDLSVVGAVALTGRVDRLRLRLQGVAKDTGGGAGIRVNRLGNAVAGTAVDVGGLELLGTGNAIGAVDAFRSGGGFALASAVPLTLVGPIEAAGAVAITGTGPGAAALRVTGSVASGTLDGAASGMPGPLTLATTQGGLAVVGGSTVHARGGALTIHGASTGAGGLTVIAAGATVTSSRDATIRGDAGLFVAGSVTGTSGVALRASAGSGPAFTLAPTGSVTSLAGPIGLSIAGAGTATLDGTLAATNGLLALDGGAVSGRGAVRVQGVTGSARALSLTGAANRIGALDALATTAGGIAVTSQDPLAIRGLVQSAGPVTLNAPVLTMPAGAVLSAPGHAIALTAGTIQADGQLVGASLSGRAAGGAARFDNAANAIGTLGDVTAGTSFLYRGAAALTVAGDVAAPGGVTIATTAAGADALRLAGSAAAGAGPVTLEAPNGTLRLTGDVTAGGAATLLAAALAQEAGTVRGASLQATTGGAATQAAGATLRATATDVAITAASLDLAGTLDAARDAMLGATTAGARLAGSISAARSVAVEAANGIVQSGSMDAGWTMSLTAQHGDVGIAGSLATGGSLFQLLDVTATRGSIRLTGDINAGFNAAVMTAGTDIVQSAGSVVGHGVSLKADGAVTQTAGLLRATGLASPASTVLGIEAARFDLAGTLDAASGIAAVALSGPGVISGSVAAGGNLSADAAAGTLTLSGTLSSLGDATFAAAAGIAQSGSVTALDSLSLVASAGPVAIGGTVRGGDLFLGAGGDLRVTGAVRAGGAMSLQAGGAIEAPGLLVGQRLFGGSGGSAALTGDNLVAELGGFRAGGDLTLRNAQPLTVLGAATAGGTMDIATSGALTLATIFGDVALDAPAIRLDAGAIRQGNGSVRTGALDARAAGDIALALPANRIPLLTARAGGDLTLVTGTALTLNGPVTAGGALSLTATGAITVPAGIEASADTMLALRGAALDLSGAISAQDLAFDATLGDIAQRAGSIVWSGTAAMSAAGAIAQTGGALLGGPGALLTGSAGGAIDLAAGGNRVPRLGPLDAGQQITVSSLGDTTVAGALAARGGALSLATAGSLTIQPVSLTGSAASLTAGADIAQQAGGSLAVPGAVALTAAGDAALDGSVTGASITITTGLATSQQAGGSMIATGPLTVTAGTDITLDGVVIGNPVTLNGGRTLSQAATGRLSTTTLTLGIGGDAGFAGGIAADLLTGTVGGALLVDGAEMRIGLLRDIAAGRRLVLVNDQALRVEGAIAAPSLIVRAAGPLTIGTVALNTAGVPYVEPPPGPLSISRLPDPVPGTPGAVFETGAPRLDIGTLTVTPLGTENATLALRLPESGGALAIADILQAPATDVTFDLGTGGSATGRINVRNLTVLGAGGTAVLEGTVRGLEGSAAASVSVIGPRVEPDYQINECPVGAVNCVLLIVQIPVITDPLKELGVTTTPDDQDDMDIYVPNVAERDF